MERFPFLKCLLIKFFCKLFLCSSYFQRLKLCPIELSILLLLILNRQFRKLKYRTLRSESQAVVKKLFLKFILKFLRFWIDLCQTKKHSSTSQTPKQLTYELNIPKFKFERTLPYITSKIPSNAIISTQNCHQ